MGFIQKLFKNQSVVRITGWSSPITTSSGEIVTSENALNLSIVYACINAKANAVAKLPLQVFQHTNAGRTRAQSHQIAYLLETRPNPQMTPYQFKHLVTTHRNLYGISYVRMVFNQGGKVVALYPLNPMLIGIAENENGEIYYIETTDLKSQTRIYKEDEIIRLPYLTRDGFTPISPISVARESIGTLKKQEKFIGSFYENGTLTRGVLKVDTQLSKNAKDAVRQAWMDANTGEDNASKIAVLDSGVTFENITIPLQDAEFIASQKFGVEQIARIFNVPAHMIGDLSHATFSNIEQMSMDFIQNTIMPETQAWEEELNYKLFTTGEQKKGFYVKFNLTAALRGDSISRGNYYKTMSEIGAYSINEIRDLEEMDAIGPAGDVHRVDLNHVSIQIADEYQLAKANAGVKGGE